MTGKQTTSYSIVSHSAKLFDPNFGDPFDYSSSKIRTLKEASNILLIKIYHDIVFLKYYGVQIDIPKILNNYHIIEKKSFGRITGVYKIDSIDWQLKKQVIKTHNILNGCYIEDMIHNLLDSQCTNNTKNEGKNISNIVPVPSQQIDIKKKLAEVLDNTSKIVNKMEGQKVQLFDISGTKKEDTYEQKTSNPVSKINHPIINVSDTSEDELSIMSNDSSSELESNDDTDNTNDSDIDPEYIQKNIKKMEELKEMKIKELQNIKEVHAKLQENQADKLFDISKTQKEIAKQKEKEIEKRRIFSADKKAYYMIKKDVDDGKILVENILSEEKNPMFADKYKIFMELDKSGYLDNSHTDEEQYVEYIKNLEKTHPENKEIKINSKLESLFG